MASPPLISVVDDDDSIRESLQSLLRSAGFAVKVFTSAEEFLNSNYSGDSECLILDVRMPGMGGIELYRRLLASNYAVPVIFITAHGSDEAVRSRALKDGAVDYLVKPFSEDSLLNAVRTALSSK